MELINGNCVEVLKTLDVDFDKCIFVSDPPFNIGYNYNSYKDRMKQDEYFNMFKKVFGRNKHVMIHYAESLHKWSVINGWCPTKVVSWVYNSNMSKQHRDIAFYGFDPDFKKVGQDYKNPSDKRIAKRISEGKKAKLYDWWNINQVKNISNEKLDHPCQMPLEVMKNIIGILPEGFIIIDPFMGTGTTGEACKFYGREFIGIELDEKYFNISKERIYGVEK